MRKVDLLAKAKASPRAPAGKIAAVSDADAMALALAWARGEVSYMQTRAAVGLRQNESNTYSVLARGLRHAVASGVLVEKRRR